MADRPDDLYALLPGEFTAARDALARELRAGGDRTGAEEVKRMRRPTVVAWAINHAARNRPDELRDLLGAGAALRRAHERLMAGEGDRAALREANEHERASVGAFARIVRDEATAAGSPLAEPALDKVRDTLHAAALDDGVRDALEHGRLEREAEAVSDAGMLTAWAPPARERGGRATSGDRGARDDAGRSTGGAAKRGDGGRDETGAGARAAPAQHGDGGGGRDEADPGASRAPAKRTAAERRAANAAHDAAIRQLREADREARRAERDAEAARRRVERAERAVEKARADLADAQADLEATRDAELDAQRDVREAKAALAAAQEAADAATEQL